ncbi:4076_t:CDS:1, partial [Funneliformis geosporum]
GNTENDVHINRNNVNERKIGNMNFNPTSLVDQILDIIEI